MTHHPIRDETINTWYAPGRDDEYKWLAKFGTGRNFPICFNAATREEVIALAERFRQETIAHNEAAYKARAANAAKARDRKAKGKGAVGAVQE